ncbi:Type II secretion system (T2SS), protein F [Raineyella antarctica]|uniref:Type II secretion system (T2SS), protein F n=1 Tax=Raineyella antarctica TaxID=1577474 RepID=A0A1G6HU89_9ACTN|nr:type II secretion system F family protein [Raineyella antarctica]SDB97036.1 Type II secretion system (T2SS), protein F [Raineyella antarctica]
MTSAAWTLLVAAIGALVGLGAVAVVRGLRAPVPSLAAGLAFLDTSRPADTAADLTTAGPASRSDRLGAWLARHPLAPLPASQRRALAARNIPIADFMAEKAVFTVIGTIVPGVVAGCIGFLAGWTPFVPVGVALAGAIIGWFVPDVTLRRRAPALRADMAESLYTYFDLVTLERLANLSAPQALASAAYASDAPLFLHLRSALDRARLEQRPPYAELRALAERLELPELADVADVMQLEESGASLTGALRARVRELRDSHLSAQKISAAKVSEQMTVFMVIPSMVFALVFLVPPLLRLTGAGGTP